MAQSQKPLLEDSKAVDQQKLMQNTPGESKSNPEVQELQNIKWEKIDQKNYIKVIILGLMFLLLLSPFNSVQSLLSEIQDQMGFHGLGQLTVATVYLVYSMVTFIIAQIVEKVPFKFGMALACIGYLVTSTGGALMGQCENHKSEDILICKGGFVWTFNIFAGSLCGFSAAVLWVSMFGYVVNLSKPQTKGLFFGTFWSIVNMSHLTGNIFAALVLKAYSHFTQFMTNIVISAAAAVGFMFIWSVPKPEKQETVEKNWKEKIVDTLRLWREKTLLLSAIIFIFVGMILGFYLGYLYLIIQKCLDPSLTKEEVNMYTAYCFISFGAFAFIGGIVCGVLEKRINIFTLHEFSFLIIEMAIFLSLITGQSKYYVAAFFAAAFWGFGECFLQSLITILVTKLTGNKLEGYAYSRLCYCIGIFLSMVLSIPLKGAPMWVFPLIMLLFQVIVNFTLNVLKTIVKF